MVGAIIAGIVVGLVGILPFIVTSRKVARQQGGSVAQTAFAGLASFAISLVVLVVGLVVCSRIARDFVLPFGIAEVVVLIGGTIAYMMGAKNHAPKLEDGKMDHE